MKLQQLDLPITKQHKEVRVTNKVKFFMDLRFKLKERNEDFFEGVKERIKLILPNVKQYSNLGNNSRKNSGYAHSQRYSPKRKESNQLIYDTNKIITNSQSFPLIEFKQSIAYSPKLRIRSPAKQLEYSLPKIQKTNSGDFEIQSSALHSHENSLLLISHNQIIKSNSLPHKPKPYRKYNLNLNSNNYQLIPWQLDSDSNNLIL